MKAIVKATEKNKPVFKIQDVEDPGSPVGNNVRIKIKSVGICTSDIHVLHEAMTMPDSNIVGHEFSGIVEETGNSVGKDIKPGDHVVCELAKGACMECKVCKSGHYELCPFKKPPGWASQGVYTEYTIQPDYCIHKVPEGISFDIAAMTEPLAIAVYGCLERANIDQNDFTVVYGMGSIGLFTLITLLDHGVENIVCVTPTQRGRQRYDLAKALGCEHVYDTEENIEDIVHELTEGWKADCVVDCSGAPPAINQGLSLLKKDGKFVALGLAGKDRISFDFNKAVLNILTMVFSASSSREAWNKAIGIIERNKEKIDKIITHRYPLEQWRTAYDKLESREAVKGVLHPGEHV